MFKKFDKYWDGLKKINKMLMVATVFDPTKKLELAKMCFEEMYGLDIVEYMEVYESLISVLRSLFKKSTVQDMEMVLIQMTNHLSLPTNLSLLESSLSTWS